MLMWAGVGAAPLAWGVEHIFGWGVSEANCDPGRVAGAFSTWAGVLCGVAAVVALGGLTAAILAFRAVKDDAGQDSDPPPGRIWLMSIFGLIVSPIFFTMIVLTGAGALLLGHCHQG
jgi:hypothetical protein